MSTFTVRPSKSEKEALRARLTAVSLLSLKLKPGDLCSIRHETDLPDQGGDRQKYAIVWEDSTNGMKDSIVGVPQFLRELHGLKLGDKVVIERTEESIQDADIVQMRPKGESTLDDQQKHFWEYYAKLTVKASHDCLAGTQTLSLKVGPKLQDFEITQAGPGNVGIGRIAEQTIFSISDATTASQVPCVTFNSTALGGLAPQIQEAQKIIDRILQPRIPVKYSPTQGVLLYGAKGVGKSLFIDELARAGWKNVIRWTPGTKTTSLRSGTLVIIDHLDLPPAQGASKPIVREIDRLFATARGKPCLIVGETRHPNDVELYLRSEGKFSVELEIPIPSALQRQQILTTLRGAETVPDDALIEHMAQRTHGYVGADLKALLRRTLELASERPPSEDAMETQPPPLAESSNDPQPSTDVGIPRSGDDQFATWTVLPTDFSLALTQVRPSALQEIFLETPSTRWGDIGGQEASKKLLENAVKRPLQQADRMAKLNLPPKKGVLLYGPPGCSKTLLVRALAREAGLNFLAVKGAELISMYVGESERATREIFRKARAASPSIIFFDEIDAIATRSKAGSDLNVLTTLLNEMDGFEDLRNVFVVAATNKPESIDPALMRPGRFDNVVYISPPDIEARKEIFDKQFSLGAYQSTSRGVQDDVLYFADKTSGFSGAECVGICQTAAELALDSDRDYYRFQDVEEAIRCTPRSITAEMLEGFEAWNAARMR